jgi:DNA-binding NtrC family response regulator/pSer/pThr/pTyr-binding forkhead associated (FHA) protein
MPQLVITKGNTFRKEWVFTDTDILTIGRDTTNDIVLPDPSRQVSRWHAAIVKCPGVEDGYFIRDLGSLRATKVGGAVIYQHLLREGDVINIVDYALLYSQEVGVDPSGDELIVVVPKQAKNTATHQRGNDVEPRTVPRTHQALLQEIPLTPDRQEVVEELLSRAEAVRELGTLFAEMVEPLLRVMRADRGFVALFREAPPGTYDGVGIHGFDPKKGERIEISTPSFCECLLRNVVVQEHTTLLVPMVLQEEPLGFFCVDRKPPATPYAPADISFLRLLGKLAITCTRGRAVGRQREQRASHAAEVLAWPKTLVGNRNSPTMAPVYQQIARAASTDEPVLLLGETGTGKGAVALAIHAQSSRHKEPFVDVDPPNIPRDLVGSELLGHTRGAFTGATEDKKGRFERADKGTIFLDEIGALSSEWQANLLKPIADKQITRLGAGRPTKVDVRVIAATDKDLDQARARGTFSDALYHRLNRFRIYLPPLRERKEDIPLLSYYFLDLYAKKYGKNTKTISHTAIQYLRQYEWPGNIRELEGYISTAVSTGKDVLFSWDFPPAIQQVVEEQGGAKETPAGMEEVEKKQILEVLAYTKGNKKRAYTVLGWSHHTLRYKMDKYGIPRNYGSPRKGTYTSTEEGERKRILTVLEQTEGQQVKAYGILGYTQKQELLDKMDKYGIPRNYGTSGTGAPILGTAEGC